MSAADPTLSVRPPLTQPYLWVGLGVSLLIHLALLTLHFQRLPEPPAPRPASLEVVLLNLRSETPIEPAPPQALADVAFTGGGSDTNDIQRSPLPASPLPDAISAPSQPAPDTSSAPDAAQRELLTGNDAPQPVTVAPPAPEPTQESLTDVEPSTEPRPEVATASPTTTTPLTPEDDALIANLMQQFAALSQRLEVGNEQPRRHHFAPSTSPWIFAEYVEQWRDTVEAIGNQHYPPQLRGRLYGSLQMTVWIRADGTLAEIAFDTPSIHPEINEAARAIVQRAAPFAPFPDALRQQAEVLSITRTWHFENDRLSTDSP